MIPTPSPRDMNAEHSRSSTTSMHGPNGARQLLPMIDTAVYTSIVVGLICLKYAFEVFKERRAKLKASFPDPNHDHNLARALST